MKWLYRAALLAFLIRIDSTLTEIVRRLIVLRELAAHPLYIMYPAGLPQAQVDELKISLKARPASKFGGALKRHDESFNASPSATTPTTTTTAPTVATGRSAETSGETGEGSVLPLIPKTHPEYSKTLWRTPATEQEAGSLGAALDNLAFGPRHDHGPRLVCATGCPAYYALQRAKIVAEGFKPVCMASLSYPMADCDKHPHIAGEAL